MGTPGATGNGSDINAAQRAPSTARSILCRNSRYQDLKYLLDPKEKLIYVVSTMQIHSTELSDIVDSVEYRLPHGWKYVILVSGRLSLRKTTNFSSKLKPGY